MSQMFFFSIITTVITCLKIIYTSCFCVSLQIIITFVYFFYRLLTLKLFACQNSFIFLIFYILNRPFQLTQKYSNWGWGCGYRGKFFLGFFDKIEASCVARFFNGSHVNNRDAYRSVLQKERIINGPICNDVMWWVMRCSGVRSWHWRSLIFCLDGTKWRRSADILDPRRRASV